MKDLFVLRLHHLERSVTQLGLKATKINSHVDGEYLDGEKYWPLFEAAESLDVPVYIHPKEPPRAMREMLGYPVNNVADIAHDPQLTARGLWHDAPGPNGKTERFVQTSLREWACARAYDTSEQRRAELPAFLFRYNGQRPHGGINGRTPISRLGLAEDNLLSIHI